MTQTAEHEAGNGKQTLGAAAAAMASPPANAADAENGATTTDEDGEDHEGSKRVARKTFVVTGELYEFQNNREAEKFLNSAEAPKAFRVLKGNELTRRDRVTIA